MELKYAYLAGGCFWGMEKYLQQIPGVIDTEVGYVGGSTEDATYSKVSMGNTGHAETVKVSYDSNLVSYETIIRYFFRIHDPTTKNRQHNDIGTQYRSAIFTNNEDEINIIKKMIQKIDQEKVFSSPIVTIIEKFHGFYIAEDYHQDYLEKNPGGYNCHLLRADFKF